MLSTSCRISGRPCEQQNKLPTTLVKPPECHATSTVKNTACGINSAFGRTGIVNRSSQYSGVFQAVNTKCCVLTTSEPQEDNGHRKSRKCPIPCLSVPHADHSAPWSGTISTHLRTPVSVPVDLNPMGAVGRSEAAAHTIPFPGRVRSADEMGGQRMTGIGRHRCGQDHSERTSFVVTGCLA